MGLGDWLRSFFPPRRAHPVPLIQTKELGAIHPTIIRQNAGTRLQDILPGHWGGRSSEEKAFSDSSVWASITLLADSVAQVPRPVYQRTDEGRVRLEKHPLARVLRWPNDLQSDFTFWRTSMLHLMGWGNSYAIITRAAGVVTELELVHPSRVDIVVNDDQTISYVVNPFTVHSTLGAVVIRSPVPDQGLPIRIIPSEDMLHVLNYSFDGVSGVSPLRLHALTVDAALSQQIYGTHFYKNAPNMSGVIETDKAIGPKESKDLRERLKGLFAAGGTEQGNVAILTNGLKFSAMTAVSPTDSDYVAARKLSSAEISSIYRVPVTFLNDTSAATFSNVAQFSIGFVRYTLSPIFRNIEAEVNRKLVRERDWGDIYMEHQSNALLASNMQERYNAYSTGLAAGFLTGNEVRELENLPPLDGLDDSRVPMNSAPAGDGDTQLPNPEGPRDEQEPDETIRMAVLR